MGSSTYFSIFNSIWPLQKDFKEKTPRTWYGGMVFCQGFLPLVLS